MLDARKRSANARTECKASRSNSHAMICDHADVGWSALRRCAKRGVQACDIRGWEEEERARAAPRTACMAEKQRKARIGETTDC
eukprot:3491737-Rhodomonas_salina.1